MYIYSFIRLYEMGYQLHIFECYAKDLHDAMLKAIRVLDLNTIDAIMCNGEYI